MTNIGHFRAASRLLEGKSDIPVRLWIAPPTKMDQFVLTEEGHYGILGRTGARMSEASDAAPGIAVAITRFGL